MGNNDKITGKKVYSSLIWKLLERIFSQGINLAVQIILARLIMPSEFGSLALITAIINYAAIFVQSGIGTVIIQKKHIDQKDISTLFSISLLLATVLYIVLFVISPYVAAYYKIPVLKPALRVLALVLFLNAFNAIQTGILSRKMKFRQLFLRTMIAVPIAGIVGISLACLEFGIWALIAHNLVNMTVVIIVMSFDKDTHIVKWGLFRDRLKELYTFSLKILLTSLVSGAHDMVRTIIIGKKYTTDELAYYDKAYTYSYYAVSTIGSSISSVLLPTFSRNQDDWAKLKTMSRKAVSMSAFVMAPTMIGIASIARPLVLTLLTDKWEACVPFLILFCYLRIPSFIMTIDKQVYYAVGRSEINLFYEIALCILNIITLFITTQLGVLQVAMGATIVEYIGCISICLIASKVYGYSLKERVIDIYKPILSALIMGFLISLIPRIGLISNLITVILQMSCGVILYLTLSIVLKDSNITEIKNIFKTMLHK